VSVMQKHACLMFISLLVASSGDQRAVLCVIVLQNHSAVTPQVPQGSANPAKQAPQPAKAK
jgi:hypothetical protein